MQIKSMQVLLKLKKLYNLKSVKYDVLTKSFIYVSNENEEKSITLDSLLNVLNKNDEIYKILEALKSSYFPRRLREVIKTFYKEHEIPLPKELLIGEKGFEIDINNEKYYIEYFDEFDIFLKEMAKLYNVPYKEINIEPNFEEYIGEYHNKK